MINLEVWVNNKRRIYHGPTSWDELTPHQAVGLIRVRALLSKSSPLDGQPTVLFTAIRLLYGIKLTVQRWLFDKRLLFGEGYSDDDITVTLALGQTLLDGLKWIVTENPGAAFLLPSLRFGDFKFGSLSVIFSRFRLRLRYMAPAEALATSTFAEFIEAEKAYSDGDYARLTAILYRPEERRKWTLDARKPLDDKSLQIRAALFTRLDPAVVQLIVLHYEATRRFLQSCFPHVFPQMQSDADRQKNASGNWLDVAIGMAKLDVTKIDQIEKTNLYLALKVLNEQLKQAQQMQDQLDKMKAR